MIKRFCLGVDDSQNTLEALENLGGLFLKSEANFHLFHAMPESTLPARPPSSAETIEWEHVQKREAQQVLDKALSSLLQMGYKRSRLSTESMVQGLNEVQDVRDAGRDAEIEAIVLARRRRRSRLNRFIPETTTADVYHYANLQNVWAVSTLPLQPPLILAAVDESDYADRIVAHVAKTLGSVPEVRITLLNIMPSKPPAYWDDGHILDKSELVERKTVVKQWRWEYEEVMGGIFSRSRGVLTRAGIAEECITTRMQSRRSGIAHDVLSEVSRGGYNILALGRRGSGISPFDLGSRASKILRSAPDCTLILVN